MVTFRTIDGIVRPLPDDGEQRSSQSPTGPRKAEDLSQDIPQPYARTRGYVNPNAYCPVCHAPVYFYQSPFGGTVFFNDLGPPWPKHPCTSGDYGQFNVRACTESIEKAAAWQSSGWSPFFIESAQTYREYIYIHGQWKCAPCQLIVQREPFRRLRIRSNDLPMALAQLRREAGTDDCFELSLVVTPNHVLDVTAVRADEFLEALVAEARDDGRTYRKRSKHMRKVRPARSKGS